MIGISLKASYGVSALFDLALHYGVGAVPIEEIARRQKIPSDFLRQILSALRRSKLVESTRGAGGGYALARAPAEISIREILEAIEGPVRIAAVKTDDRTLASYWTDQQKKIEGAFDETLESLVHRKQLEDENLVYHI